jgi:polysaccharide biosynthesis transport protein
MTPEARAAKVMADNLTVYAVPLSNVIAIEYDAADGKTAAMVANTLAELYVLTTRDGATGSTERARDWLKLQIDDLRSKVAQAEAAVEKFRADKGLLRGQTTTLGAQEISELNTQITLAEAARVEAQAKADEISNMLATRGSVDTSSEVLNSAVIQRLREQQLSVSRRLSELSATYLPNHPKMVAVTRELADVEKQMRREALKIVDSLQGQAEIAAARAESLRNSLEGMKVREGQQLQQDVKLKELEREAAAARTLLENMLARFADASARQDLTLQPGFARIVQTASAPANHYFPKKGPTFLLISLAGLGLGLGLAFLLELMSQAARMNTASVQQYNAAMAGNRVRPTHVVQAADNPPKMPALEIPVSQTPVRSETPNPVAPTVMPITVATLPKCLGISDTTRLLRETLENGGAVDPIGKLAAAMGDLRLNSGVKTFCITSVGGSHDTAFVSVALARLLASAQIKTVIVDAVPQRPGSSDLMSLPQANGLSELVAGSTDVNKITLRDPSSSVKLISYGMMSDHETRLAVGQRMPSILNALTSIFEIVLVNIGEATPHTILSVHGSQAAVVLAPKARQRDAVAASMTLASRGVTPSLFVQLDDTANTKIAV